MLFRKGKINILNFFTKILLLLALMISLSSCKDYGCIEADDFGQYEQQKLTVYSNNSTMACEYDPIKDPDGTLIQDIEFKACLFLEAGEVKYYDEDGKEQKLIKASNSGCTALGSQYYQYCFDDCQKRCQKNLEQNSNSAETSWVSTDERAKNMNFGVTIEPGSEIEIEASGNIIFETAINLGSILVNPQNNFPNSFKSSFSEPLFYDIKSGTSINISIYGQAGDVSSGGSTILDANSINFSKRLIAYLTPHPEKYKFDTSQNSELSGNSGIPIWPNKETWQCIIPTDQVGRGLSCYGDYEALYNNINSGGSINNIEINKIYPILSIDGTTIGQGKYGGIIRSANTIADPSNPNIDENSLSSSDLLLNPNDDLTSSGYDPFANVTCNSNGICDMNSADIEYQLHGQKVSDLSSESFLYRNNFGSAIKVYLKTIPNAGDSSCNSFNIPIKIYDYNNIQIFPQSSSHYLININNNAWKSESNDAFLGSINLEPRQTLEIGSISTANSSGTNCGNFIFLKTHKFYDIDFQNSGYISFKILNNKTPDNCKIKGRIINKEGLFTSTQFIIDQDPTPITLEPDFYEYQYSRDPFTNSTILNNSSWVDTNIFVRRGQTLRIDPESWNHSSYENGNKTTECGMGYALYIEPRPALLCYGSAAQYEKNPNCNTIDAVSGKIVGCKDIAEECYNNSSACNPNCYNTISCTNGEPETYQKTSCSASQPTISDSDGSCPSDELYNQCSTCNNARLAMVQRPAKVQMQTDLCVDFENYNGSVKNIFSGDSSKKLNTPEIAKGAKPIQEFNGNYGSFGNIKIDGKENNFSVLKVLSPVTFSRSGRLKFLHLEKSQDFRDLHSQYPGNNGNIVVKFDGNKTGNNGEYLAVSLCKEESAGKCSSTDITPVEKIISYNPNTKEQEIENRYSFADLGYIQRNNKELSALDCKQDPHKTQTNQFSKFYCHINQFDLRNQKNSNYKDEYRKYRLSFKIFDPENPNCEIDNPENNINSSSPDSDKWNGILIKNINSKVIPPDSIKSTWIESNDELTVSAGEGGAASINLGENKKVSQILFASYGTPDNYTIGNCHAGNSLNIVKNACLGRQSCSVGANNNVFGDPCIRIFKWLQIKYKYKYLDTPTIEGAPDANSVCKKSEMADCDKAYICVSKYFNNVGKYEVRVRVKTQDKEISKMIGSVINPIIKLIDGDPKVKEKGAVEKIYTEIITDPIYRSVVKLSLTLMITFYGFGYLMGVSDSSNVETVSKIFKISLIYFFINDSGWLFFDRYVIDFFKRSTDEMAFLLASSFDDSEDMTQALNNGIYYDKSILFSSVDRVFDLIFAEAVQNKIKALMFTGMFGWAYFLLVCYGILLYIYAIANAVLIYLTAQVFMSILFILGPIFIIFILFKQTKDMFDNWLKGLIGFSLQQIFLITTLAFFNMLIYEVIKLVLNYRICYRPVWTIDIWVVKLTILKYWTISSSSAAVSAHSSPGLNNNLPDFPSIFAVLFIWVIGSLMGKFIEFMTNLATSIGGGISASELSSGVSQGMSQARGAMTKLAKSSPVGRAISHQIARVDQVLFDSGRLAKADRARKSAQNSKDNSDKRALLKAGDKAVSKFKSENAGEFAKMNDSEKAAKLSEVKDQAMKKAAKKMGIGSERLEKLKNEKGFKYAGDNVFGAIAAAATQNATLRSSINEQAAKTKTSLSLGEAKKALNLKESNLSDSQKEKLDNLVQNEGKSKDEAMTEIRKDHQADLMEKIESGDLKVERNKSEKVTDSAIKSAKKIGNISKGIANIAAGSAQIIAGAAAASSASIGGYPGSNSAQATGKRNIDAGAQRISSTIKNTANSGAKSAISAASSVSNAIKSKASDISYSLGGQKSNDKAEAKQQLINEGNISNRSSGNNTNLTQKIANSYKEYIRPDREKNKINEKAKQIKQERDGVKKDVGTSKDIISDLNNSIQRKEDFEKIKKSAGKVAKKVSNKVKNAFKKPIDSTLKAANKTGIPDIQIGLGQSIVGSAQVTAGSIQATAGSAQANIGRALKAVGIKSGDKMIDTGTKYVESGVDRISSGTKNISSGSNTFGKGVVKASIIGNIARNLRKDKKSSKEDNKIEKEQFEKINKQKIEISDLESKRDKIDEKMHGENNLSDIEKQELNTQRSEVKNELERKNKELQKLEENPITKTDEYKKIVEEENNKRDNDENLVKATFLNDSQDDIKAQDNKISQDINFDDKDMQKNAAYQDDDPFFDQYHRHRNDNDDDKDLKKDNDDDLNNFKGYTGNENNNDEKKGDEDDKEN